MVNQKKVNLHEGTRKCKICKIEKAITEFYLQNNKSIRSTKCKKCYCIETTKYKKKNPERYKLLDLKGSLKRRYNLTLEEYNLMIKKSKNKCTICKSKLNPKTLVLDHCHTTNRPRGILCRDCNFGIGNFKDNVKYLASAINYLNMNNLLKLV